MRRRRPPIPNRGFSNQSLAICALAVIELCGLAAVIFVGWLVRDRPELLIDILKTYMTTVLLSTLSGLIGYLKGDSTDLPVYNAQRLSELERSHYELQSSQRGSDSTPDPDIFQQSQTVTSTRKVSFPIEASHADDDPA